MTDDNPEPAQDDVINVDDEGRLLYPFFCEQCGEVMFWGLYGPGHRPNEGLTLVIDHRMHCPATAKGEAREIGLAAL